jgi:hypothetical protein
LLNNCTDGSAAVVRRTMAAKRERVSPHLRLIETDLPAAKAHVGWPGDGGGVSPLCAAAPSRRHHRDDRCRYDRRAGLAGGDDRRDPDDREIEHGSRAGILATGAALGIALPGIELALDRAAGCEDFLAQLWDGMPRAAMPLGEATLALGQRLLRGASTDSR